MNNQDEKPLTLEELQTEMQLKGWSYEKTQRNEKTYFRFEIGKDPDWSYTPLFTLYYTEAFGEPELRLRKGLSQWAIGSIRYPVLPSELLWVFRACSQYY